MTHGKRLSYLNSAVFADTVVPSGCHRTIIRWLHDDIARITRSCVTFRRHSGSFLFPSYCLREAISARCHRWSHEVITKMTRFDKMPSRWPYENEPSQGLQAICLHAKDFATAHEVAAGAWKIDRRSYDCLRCPHEWPDMARCVYDQSRIWNLPSSCVHPMSTSGQCEAGMSGGKIFGVPKYCPFSFLIRYLSPFHSFLFSTLMNASIKIWWVPQFRRQMPINHTHKCLFNPWWVLHFRYKK